MVDLLQGGQAVFAIAVGRQVRDVEGTLTFLRCRRGVRRDPQRAFRSAESLLFGP